MRGRAVKGLSLVFVGLAASALVMLAACSAADPGDQVEPVAKGSPVVAAGASQPATPAPEPAPVGTPLGPLSQPPERSLWALAAESYDEGAHVDIDFEPYGIGPSSFGASIVALVLDATPADPAARVPDLVGRNVVFILGTNRVDSGGHYTGTAVTRKRDDRIVFVLQDAALAK